MKTIRKILVPVIVLGLAAVGYLIWRESTRVEGYGPGFAGGNGRLEATEIDISTKLAGRIALVNVDEGDFVTPGQVLAVMQTDVLEARLGEARAKVAKAVAAEAGMRAQVAVKEKNLEAARATVHQRQSEHDKTVRRLRRTVELLREKALPQQQYDDDETTSLAAKAAVDEAKAQIGVAEAEIAAAKADAASAAAAIKEAEAAAATIEADIKDCHLISPRGGRVQYRVSQPGEVLAAGGRVLNFVDLSDVYMNFYLPTGQAGRLALGAEARIVLDALPDVPIPATVAYVASTAQFTPKTVETELERQKLMFRVKVKIDPNLLADHLEYIKTGVPGVAWIKMDADARWPAELAGRDASGPARGKATLPDRAVPNR